MQQLENQVTDLRSTVSERLNGYHSLTNWGWKKMPHVLQNTFPYSQVFNFTFFFIQTPGPLNHTMALVTTYNLVKFSSGFTLTRKSVFFLIPTLHIWPHFPKATGSKDLISEFWNLFNIDSRPKFSTQDPIFQSVESPDPTYEIPRVNPDWFMYPLVARSHLACTWTTVAIPSAVVLWYPPGGNFTGNAPYIYHLTTLNHVQVIHFTE